MFRWTLLLALIINTATAAADPAIAETGAWLAEFRAWAVAHGKQYATAVEEAARGKIWWHNHGVCVCVYHYL